MNYWLVKSEPEDFSIDQLKKNKKTLWTGVRNYQARNFMTQSMKKGDLVIFYHSNAEPSGVAGLAVVSSSKPVPDPLQFDSKSDYFEKRATPQKPVWECVELSYQAHAKNYLSLDQLKQIKKLEGMRLLQKGNRLSILPISPEEFEVISKIAAFE